MRVSARALDIVFKNETPSGTVNGANTSFTLSADPYSVDAVLIFLNGIKLKKTTHYSISGTTITMVIAPETGQELEASYLSKN
jgi:hypothetical protein